MGSTEDLLLTLILVLGVLQFAQWQFGKMECKFCPHCQQIKKDEAQKRDFERHKAWHDRWGSANCPQCEKRP